MKINKDKIYDYTITILLLIAVIIGLLLGCKSCNAQTSVSDIPQMEYYDASGEDFDDQFPNYIPIYADGVVDFIYCTQDEEYIIEYMDDDYFDLDNLPQTVNCANGDSVVSIYCSEEIFFEYLDWYSKLGEPARDQEAFYAANETFIIKEQWCGDEENGYWYYRLVKR